MSTEDFGYRSDADAVADAFGRLRAAADTVPPRSPAAARALGIRQLRARTVAAVVAVSMVTGGIVAVSWLAARRSAAPVVGVSLTPTPSSTPSEAPPTSEPAPTSEPVFPVGSHVAAPPGCSSDYWAFPASPHAGEPIPVAAMLTDADWGPCWRVSRDTPGYTVYEPAQDLWALPDPCIDHAPYPADDNRLAGRSRGFHGGIELGGFESLTRYAPGQAQAFLQQVRGRVAACASFPDPWSPGEQHSLIAAEGFAGDESFVVYTGSASTPGGYMSSYVAVVRVGDYVLVVDHGSDLTAVLTLATTMAVKATARLTAVIGG